MQGGMDNVPFYIHQNPLAIYPSQGINIFLSPSLPLNPAHNFLTPNTLTSSNDQNILLNNKIDPNNTLGNLIIDNSNIANNFNNTITSNFNNNIDNNFTNIIDNNFNNNINNHFNNNTIQSNNDSDNVELIINQQVIKEDDKKQMDEEEEEEDDEEEEDEYEAVSELTEDQLTTYKKKIEEHPLFSLISILFERCEQSTTTGVINSVKSIDADIVSCLLKMGESTDVTSGDEEVDQLMQRTIEVLKIHTIELEKVQELCKDFCSRYINTLKTNLHPSQLVQTDGDEDYDVVGGGEDGAVSGGSGGGVGKGSFMPQGSLGQVVSGGTVYQMVQTPQGLVAQPIQISPQMISNQATATQKASDNIMPNPDQQYADEDPSCSRRHKRGVLPKKATKVMKTWLFQHLSHPYPTEDEKRQIATQTNLTILQVNNWFINGRRRILQPMMNSAVNSDNINKNNNNNTDVNNNSNNNKPKTKRSTKKVPQQKFWSESCLGNNVVVLNNTNNNNVGVDNNDNNNNDFNNNNNNNDGGGGGCDDNMDADGNIINNNNDGDEIQGTVNDNNNNNSIINDNNNNDNSNNNNVYNVGDDMTHSDVSRVVCPDDDGTDDNDDDDEDYEEDDDTDEGESVSNNNEVTNTQGSTENNSTNNNTNAINNNGYTINNNNNLANNINLITNKNNNAVLSTFQFSSNSTFPNFTSS